MTILTIFKGLLAIAGVILLTFGGFLLLLTSTGDRGGDSGIHEQGCIFVVGGIAALLLALGIQGFEGG